MSNGYDAITWAIRARGISAGSYRLLIEMAKRVGKRGFDVWPSQPTMADDAEMSTSSVRRCIEELITAMLIERIPTQRKNGATSSNVYRLQVRTAHDFASSSTQWVRPDDGQDPDEVDDDQPGDPVLNLDGGGAQDEQGALFTGEGCSELESNRTNLTEESPSDDEIVRRWQSQWQAMVDRVPSISAISTFSETRRKHLLARVSEHAKPATADSVQQLFETITSRIEGSRFLRGLKIDWVVPGTDWVLNKTNFNKIMEGAYVQDFDTSGPAGPPATRSGERSHVAAGQAAVDALRSRGFH